MSSLTIGFPSFVLALQPNHERVRGNFITNVLRRAVPGGVSVALVCLGVMVAGRNLGLSEPVVSTLCTLVAGFTGLCVLTLACLPMNAIRAGLTALMAVAMVFAMLLFPSVFYLVPIAGNAVWLLVGAIVASAAVLALATQCVLWAERGERAAVSGMADKG